MKKIGIFLACTIAFVTLKSDTLPDYNVRIPAESIVYEEDGDFTENEILGRDLDTEGDVVVQICPGKQVDCRVTVIDAFNNPTIILAKKTRGGKDVVITNSN